MSHLPRISLIIPSWQGNVTPLQTSIHAQNTPPHEIEVVVGVSPNGRARNEGVRRTTGDILVFVDDDAVLGREDALHNLIQPLLADPTIHITGASKLIPPDSTWFQRWVAREIPRIEHPIVQTPLETTPLPPHFETELTTTCCAMRRTDFDALGGFDEMLVRGVDTEFFVRAGRANYRFVLVPQTWTWHPAPATLRALWRKHFWYGYGHAQELAQDPSRARGLQKRPWLYLLFRTLILLPNIFLPYSYASPEWRLGFKPLKAFTSYAGAWGFFWQSLPTKP